MCNVLYECQRAAEKKKQEIDISCRFISIRGKFLIVSVNLQWKRN